MNPQPLTVQLMVRLEFLRRVMICALQYVFRRLPTPDPGVAVQRTALESECRAQVNARFDALLRRFTPEDELLEKYAPRDELDVISVSSHRSLSAVIEESTEQLIDPGFTVGYQRLDRCLNIVEGYHPSWGSQTAELLTMIMDGFDRDRRSEIIERAMLVTVDELTNRKLTAP